MHLTGSMRRRYTQEFKKGVLTGINCDKDSLIIRFLILIILSIKNIIIQGYL